MRTGLNTRRWREDMPLLSQWITKNKSLRNQAFISGGGDGNRYEGYRLLHALVGRDHPPEGR